MWRCDDNCTPDPAIAGRYDGGHGISSAKAIWPNLGRPKPNRAVAWGKGMHRQHHNVDYSRKPTVHLQGSGCLTACKKLCTSASPYLGMGGHVSYATSADVSCRLCERVMGRA